MRHRTLETTPKLITDFCCVKKQCHLMEVHWVRSVVLWLKGVLTATTMWLCRRKHIQLESSALTNSYSKQCNGVGHIERCEGKAEFWVTLTFQGKVRVLANQIGYVSLKHGLLEGWKEALSLENLVHENISIHFLATLTPPSILFTVSWSSKCERQK